MGVVITHIVLQLTPLGSFYILIIEQVLKIGQGVSCILLKAWYGSPSLTLKLCLFRQFIARICASAINLGKLY